MGRVVSFEAPGTVRLVDEEDPALGPGDVRVATLYSGISAGTELTAYRGSNPYLAKRWDPDRRLFVEGRSTIDYPVRGWGYEEVGRVIELGPDVRSVEPGQVVWGTWGHRSGTVVTEGWASARILPPTADPIVGVFSQIGAIALNAVLDANVHLGETVAVFGQGVPGLVVTQLVRLNGGRVIAVDGIAKRLDLARALGADAIVNFTSEDPAETIKELTDGRGADVSIEISGSARALHEAIRSTAYNSRVVVSGFFQGEGLGLSLGEEFHHNRIELVCSQISGVGRAVDHRWDEGRLQRTAMDLIASGRVDTRPLISHVIDATDVEEAFALLDRHPEECLQVVLRFAGDA